MIGGDGVPFINSFAHGHTIYRLRYDAARGACADCSRPTDAVAELVRLDGMAELSAVERTALVQEVARRGDAGVRDIRALLKVAAKERARAPDCGGTRAGEGRTQRPAPPDGAAVPRCRVAAGD